MEMKNTPIQLILYAINQWSLCNKYAYKTGVGNNTNVFIKGISLWLLLKNETTSGIVKNYRSQLPYLAAICKMSVRTFDKYLSWLKNEGLVHVNAKNLFLHDYKVLRKYGINIKDRLPTFIYDIENTTTLSEVIVSIALQKMQQRRMQMYWKKINENPDVYKTLYDLLIFFKADATRLHDPEYFRQMHLELMLQSYREEKPGQPIYNFLHGHIEANPDLNCKANTYAKKMGYNSAMSFCHLKFRLQKKRLIEVEKDHVESECQSRKDEKIFHHRWIKENKITTWFRCDQITVNTETIYGRK